MLATAVGPLVILNKQDEYVVFIVIIGFLFLLTWTIIDGAHGLGFWLLSRYSHWLVCLMSDLKLRDTRNKNDEKNSREGVLGLATYRLSTPDCPGARRKLGKLKIARRTSAVIYAQESTVAQCGGHDGGHVPWSTDPSPST